MSLMPEYDLDSRRIRKKGGSVLLRDQSSTYSSSFDRLSLENPEEKKNKVQLCRQFFETRWCPYGERCKFAHGVSQLLTQREGTNKYKTRCCLNFKNKGFCIYGSRCNFIHEHSTDAPERSRSDWSSFWQLQGIAKCSSRLLFLLGSHRE